MAGFKSKLKHNKFIVAIVMLFRKIFRNNIIKKGKGNRIEIDGLMKGARIRINGKGNEVSIKNPKANERLKIFINGNNNRIIIEQCCILKDLTVWIEDNRNEVLIGKDTLICGNTRLSCIEGQKITIGERCMFSDGIEVRTGDSHSILNEQGKRTNPSDDVIIDDHVWVGQDVTILKGVRIAQNSILATKAVITKAFEQKGVLLAGNPAKIVKEHINWDVARLPVEEHCDE